MAALRTYQRIYWMVIFFGLSLFLCSVIQKIWTAFVTRPLSFTVDTNYLNWTTTFPAISICEIYNTEKMWDLNERIYGADRNKYLDDLMTDVTFFSGLCYSCKKCETNKEFCARLSLDNIAKSFRTSCDHLLVQCKWNGEPFECCEGFLELHSEFGVCYTINSIHTSPPFGKRLISDRESGPGLLELMTLEDVELYLHSTEDIPSKSTDRNLHDTILYGAQKEILFGVQEIINEEDVKDTSIEKRRCRFAEEVANSSQPIYEYHSYSACMIQCSFGIQLDTCGCVHHLMPRGRTNVSICGFEGLNCLTDSYDAISTRRRKECHCMISCTEQEINIIYTSNDNGYESYDQLGTKVKIGMITLPKMRYIRKTVRSMLDFIISLGGIFGLLYGASIITLVELVFNGYRRWFSRLG